MGLREQISDYLRTKRTQTAMVLELLTKQKYVTSRDIILLGCEGREGVVFSTCPHKFIETLRKYFGKNAILDEPLPAKNSITYKGVAIKTSNNKRYYLNYGEGA